MRGAPNAFICNFRTYVESDADWRPGGVRSGAVPVPGLVAETAERLELTGTAGDAWILHPLTAHRSMPNPDGPRG